eukprot:s1849_g10.t1
MVALTHPSAKQCHGVTLRLLGQFGARRLRFSMTLGRLASAHSVVVNHACGGLGLVNELIAETMLSQMKDIMSTGGETQRTWARVWLCMQHLEAALQR